MKEKALCISLGLSRDLIKELRSSYEKGTHWTKTESKKPEHLWEIEWTPAGIEMLKQNLGLKCYEEVSSPDNQKGAVYCKYKNPRMLGVMLGGKESTVVCRDSSKFGIGMPVDVRWDGGRWVVVRHPRFNGKY